MGEKRGEQPPVGRKISLRSIRVVEAQNQAEGRAQAAVEQVTSPVAGSLKKSLSTRSNCLCSPTTHVGSFRCRLHRNGSNFRRGHSVGSDLSDLASKFASAKPSFHTATASSVKLMP